MDPMDPSALPLPKARAKKVDLGGPWTPPAKFKVSQGAVGAGGGCG
jgi:hypothetical protein